MTSPSPTIVWFRQDLRLDDNPALGWAAKRGAPVIPVYILDDESPGAWAMGGASRWWLEKSLAALDASLRTLGSRLILKRGEAGRVLRSLVSETGAAAVAWNRLYDQPSIARDTGVKTFLKERGVNAESFNAGYLNEPWEVRTRAGGWFKVYTRYWMAMRDLGDPMPPSPPPASITARNGWPAGDALEDWGLYRPGTDWAAAFPDYWKPGEAGARERLSRFLNEAVGIYADKRDFPAVPATSGLSPHLHFGEISPRRIWSETVAAKGWSKSVEKFLKEVVWREFANHVLFHAPGLPETPMNPAFAAFPWAEDGELLTAWRRGRTGYPIVDAGMRELWTTGTMHNRVRMVAASFLVKHLLQPWQAGERWFWDTLVDADLASNAFSWQWVAGCGADAAPYFRIFNPILQGEKFDPGGVYIRRWAPELSHVPDRFLNKPWKAPLLVLKEAGVTLGETYPEPIVDHGLARKRALDAFASIKRG